MQNRGYFKILLLEDDELFLETLEEYLLDKGYKVTTCKNGEEVLDTTFEESFELYLLDINVPKINGLELLSSLRESGDNTPAIFITSYNTKEKLLEGYSSGCDDFIKKPFDLDELLCKIEAILYRSYGKKDRFIVIEDDIVFDVSNLVLLKGKDEISLSKKESELLKMLLLHRGQIVSKSEIFSELWGEEIYSSEGSLRVYVNTLKRHLGANVENIRGIGYRFKG